MSTTDTIELSDDTLLNTLNGSYDYIQNLSFDNMNIGYN